MGDGGHVLYEVDGNITMRSYHMYSTYSIGRYVIANGVDSYLCSSIIEN